MLEGVAARLAEDTSVCALKLLVYEALSYEPEAMCWRVKRRASRKTLNLIGSAAVPYSQLLPMSSVTCSNAE